MTPGLEVFSSRDGLMAAAAGRIADALRSGIAERGTACAALSGGATPGPAYERLALQALPWSAVSFALVDERCVPVADEASNEGMLRRTLTPAIAGGAKIFPMYAEGLTPHSAAEAADRRYAPLRFDIAVLGMGADAHTASWFPGAAGLTEALDPLSSRTVVAVNAPQANGVAGRLSLTRAAVARAERVLLLITGREKRDVLARSIGRDPRSAPVAALFSGGAAPEVLWAP